MLYQAIAASSNGITISSNPNQLDNPLIYINRSFDTPGGLQDEVVGTVEDDGERFDPAEVGKASPS